jgi:hypothetical protein
MSLAQRLNRKWNNWLQKVSESNKKQFGDQVPDCCSLLNKDGNEGIENRNGHRATRS